MNLDILRDELLNDPISRGYVSMDELEVIQSLLFIDRAKLMPISSKTLLGWVSANGRFMKMTRAAEDTSLSDEIRSIALASRIIIERNDIELDLNASDVAAMLEALVTVGILTISDRDELFTLGTINVNRAEELELGQRFQQDDIMKARS